MTNYSEFHDGSFDGLWIEESRTHVFLRTDAYFDSGNKQIPYTLVATNVIALAAGNFKPGNIVLDVEIREHHEVTGQDIMHLEDLRPGRENDLHQRDRRLAEVSERKLRLLDISPSYGATCSILAHEFELLERTEWIKRFILPQAV